MYFSSCIAMGLALAPAVRNPELRAVSLSLRQKQSLYYNLGQLLRNGVPFPRAVESLARSARGSQRRVLARMQDAVLGGKTVAESFASQRPEVSEMEIGITAACERSGRLEHGFSQLSDYFRALAEARETIWKKSAYPLFVLHFGIFALNLPLLFSPGGGAAAYVKATIGLLALLYGVALVVALAAPLLGDAGSGSAWVDSLLRCIPFVGKIRRAFSTSRFCATYDMQLEAGINVLDALQAAQRASRSGLIRAAVERTIPEVRAGAQVGALLAVSSIFPEPMIRSFCVGEETGKLHEELPRLAAEYRTEGLARVATLAEWVPRLVYVAILIYVGYAIVSVYRGYMGQVEKLANPD
jgi:general secretion pathway protein F